MTKKAGKKVTAPVNPMFVVGLDDKGKPRGAKFNETNDLVVSAAVDMLLTAVVLPSPAFADLAVKLPQGRLYASGKAFIPNIKRALHDELMAVLAQPGDASQPLKLHPPEQSSDDLNTTVRCISPMTSGLPRNWDEIGVGHLVLAMETIGEGYYECICQKRESDLLTLRYRDAPKYPVFVRHVSTVALINPGPALGE